MLLTKAAGIIDKLPQGMKKSIMTVVVDKYLNKYADMKVEGIDNLKNAKKPTIFICNHLSNADGLVLNKMFKENGMEPIFVKGVKLETDPLTSVGAATVRTTPIIPDSADKEGIKKIMNYVKEGESIVIFPEGTRSRTGQLIEAKGGITFIARMTKAPIVPLGLTGTENLMSINKEGEMGKEKFAHADVRINIGEQFEMLKKEKGQDRKEYEKAAADDMMYRIADLIPEEYRGVYKK